MWDQEVHAITASLSPNPIALSWMDRQLPTYPASNAAQSAKDLLRHLLQLDPQKREQRITDLRALVATEVRPSILDRHVSQYELNQYAKHTLLSFGAHGHTHQPLLTLDQTSLEQELRLCREIIASVCGQSYIDVLNFPFGNQNQISPGLLQSIMAEGFIAALYDGDGVARPGDHLYALPRLLLSQETRILETYELQGLATALDEVLLVVTGSEKSKGGIL